MCGVNGIFDYRASSGVRDNTELLATRDAMRARGPDGCGEYLSMDGRCGLGHRRLSIIDLSDRASQPMKSADGRFAITFNGEIYNYPQLRSELASQGTCFQTSSDTEVLLHLYALYGASMATRLRGMFAFAIWDEIRRGLYLGRDPYGIKPLYTDDDGSTFRFASQVKALLAGGHVSRDAEPAGIVGFHLFGSVPEPFTLYRGIRAFPAGHTQWVGSQGPDEAKPFANVAEALANGTANVVSAEEVPERVRAATLDSVRAHLLADVDVGVFLSAGIDSGALLGLMRDAGKREIQAITLAFDEFRGTPEDETPLAARVSHLYGARHIIRRVNQQEFVDDLPTIFEAMDQPSIDGVNAWFVSKIAKQAGLKVALSGLGGDELFSGYRSFVDVPRWRRLFGVFSALPGFGAATRKAIGALLPAFTHRRPKAIGLFEYTATWASTYLLRRCLFLPHELPQVIDPEIAREGLRRLQPLQRLAASMTPDPRSDVARVCALESTHYMRNQLLRDADWAGMAHGVEIRVPLVDFTLLRALAPVIRVAKAGAGKDALAEAPIQPLPKEVVTRVKTGFRVPTHHWISAATGPNLKAATGIHEREGLVSRHWSRVVLEHAFQV